jgi:hypothetical protein
MDGKPFALDYTAVMAIGAALGADMEMLADVLPDAEAAIVARFAGDDGGD